MSKPIRRRGKSNLIPGLVYPIVFVFVCCGYQKIRAKVNCIIRFDVSPSVLYYSGIFYIPQWGRGWVVCIGISSNFTVYDLSGKLIVTNRMNNRHRYAHTVSRQQLQIHLYLELHPHLVFN